MNSPHSPGAFDRSVASRGEPKRPCRVTVTAPGWHGARTAAIAAGCSSVSDMLEKLGRGELSIVTSDAIQLDPVAASHAPVHTEQSVAVPLTQPQHIYFHTATAPTAEPAADSELPSSTGTALLKLIITGLCAALIIGSLLYIADRLVSLTTRTLIGEESIDIEDIVTPVTGDIVAGYEVSDEYGIRPFHPVTGEPNVPHNGVDLATPIGTPIYAVGKAGDTVTVECWWDVDGGGWVVDQTADSYPGYTFQSLHMSENGCREGEAKAGEAIAYSGNSGLGTGAHYDFRVKIDGEYVPPATQYLESAVTGEPPKE
ncbi:M23 family metallopeptidase [Leptolyngbya sp. BC1307]|uniref:M23 family metallopeptidase n=1 Tax=Leptolyngbya sp. BC1307 TaxID=2029589 RepID=UPI000EFAF209|nr:M23 family metallopeptidase [Leptolyngbya sp. BC1307]